MTVGVECLRCFTPRAGTLEFMTQTVVPDLRPVAGSRIELTITDIAFGGEGVGRLDDFVVFVPFVLPGETVEVELIDVKRRYGRAQLIRVIRPSPDRVDPPCRYFGRCGGCQYQHIPYAEQLRIKHRQVEELFRRVGDAPEAVIDPLIPCPSPFGYRNRIMIRSQWDKFKKGLNIGFIRADSRLVEDIEECLIAEPALNQEIARVRAHPPPRGGLKVVLRVAPEGWEVPRDSFFQNNFHLLPKLVETVRRCLQEGGTRHLVDLYCGVGFFGIELADLVESFTGIESDVQAIRAARQNAAARGRTNGTFIAATAEEALPGVLRQWKAAETTVILDPPRRGLSPGILNLLRELRPARIIYVSCHPATLARDLNVLCGEAVFKMDRITPLDMFPQTQHVECVAQLRAGEEAGPIGPIANQT